MDDEEERLILNYIEDEEILDINSTENSPNSSRSFDENQNEKSKSKSRVAVKNVSENTTKGNKAKNRSETDITIKIEDDASNDASQTRYTNNSLHLNEESLQIGVKCETAEEIQGDYKYDSQHTAENVTKKRRALSDGKICTNKSLKKINGLKSKCKTTDGYCETQVIDLKAVSKIKTTSQLFPCTKCLYVGNSKANLDRHTLLHLDPSEIKWYNCNECSYKTKYEHQLKSHYIIHAKPEELEFFQCPHCDLKCSRKHNLTHHIKAIHSDREYSFKCAECQYKTFSKERLVAHMKKHSKEVFSCNLCKFMTNQEKYLQSHVKLVHTEVEKPFPCDTCSYKGKTKKELEKHYDRMHNKDKLHMYQCHHCNFNSIYKKNLEFHLLHMHQNSEGFQKFICGHCQKDFAYKNGLKTHIIRCHIKLPEEDWHKCLECKYKSKDVNTLKRHIRRNHGSPRLNCKQCDFTTNRQISMDAHMKTHTCDEKDILKCSECPYRILQISSFLYHMRVIHGKQLTPKEATEKYSATDE